MQVGHSKIQILVLAEEKVPVTFNRISEVVNGASELLTEDGAQNKNSCPARFVSIGVKEDCLANCTWIRELKYDWTEVRQEVCSLEEELYKDAVCHQLCSTCTANTLPRKLWMGLETSTSEGILFKL